MRPEARRPFRSRRRCLNRIGAASWLNGPALQFSWTGGRFCTNVKREEFAECVVDLYFEGRTVELRKESLAGIPLVTVLGDIDHSSSDEFEAVMDEIKRDDDRRVLVDLAGCPYIDSGGLAVLLALARWVDNAGFVGVIACNANLRRLFEIVGLTQNTRFHMFTDREEASRSVEAR